MPSNKQFGFFCTTLTLICSVYFYIVSSFLIANILLISSALLISFSIYFSILFSIPNYLWYKLGIILGLIVGPVVMGFIFFILISPLSMLLRLFGRDLLSLRNSTKHNSFWKIKDNEIDGKINFKNQF